MLNNMRVQSLIFPINSITEHTYNFFFLYSYDSNTMGHEA